MFYPRSWLRTGNQITFGSPNANGGLSIKAKLAAVTGAGGTNEAEKEFFFLRVVLPDPPCLPDPPRSNWKLIQTS